MYGGLPAKGAASPFYMPTNTGTSHPFERSGAAAGRERKPAATVLLLD